MNIELYYELDDCLSICHRLLRLLEEDEESFSAAVRGEVRDQYRQNCQLAAEHVEKIKKQLLILQDEQLL